MRGDAEQGLGVEQIVVEALDAGPLAGRAAMAAQVDGEQFDAGGVQPPGERRVASCMFR
jgi:hypothetical protein